jgi:hypothetical protein
MFLGAAISAVVASGKNRNVVGWAALGALLPLISIVIVCSLPKEGQLELGGPPQP